MPIPIAYETADYQANETLKGFTDTDSLGKAYLDLHGKVSSGSIELLPEEMRKDPAVSVFKTVPDLVKGYVETKKMVGGIEKAPEKPDGYKFTPLANLHTGINVDNIQGALRTIAHKAGLGNKSADVYQQEVLTMLSNQALAQDTAKKDLALKNETTLRAEWGSDFDKKFDSIVKIMTTAGGPEALADTNNISAALKGSPVFLKMMGKIVGMLSEDSIGKLGEGAAPEIKDAKAAQDAIVSMNAEIVTQGLKHPFHDAKHPDHAKVKQQMDNLFKIAYPTS